MKEASLAIAGRNLKLGVCIPCEFVWFDSAAYESISPPPPPGCPSVADGKPVPQAAREAIALFQDQEMAERARWLHPEPDADWKTLPAVVGLPV